MEKPSGGGSYVRLKNGTLIRAGEVEANVAPPTATQPEKPAGRTPRAATTKDK